VRHGDLDHEVTFREVGVGQPQRSGDQRRVLSEPVEPQPPLVQLVGPQQLIVVLEPHLEEHIARSQQPQRTVRGPFVLASKPVAIVTDLGYHPLWVVRPTRPW
jgi:hypothetical protein